MTSASRQWSDNTPVGGQQYGYAYDQIGNRTSATTNGRQSAYTANALNEYSQRTVPGAVDVVGTAAPQANVSINGQAAARQQGGYFYGSATADNSQDAVDVNIDVKAVAAQSIANTQAKQQGHLFVPKTPESFSHDLDGNLASDGHWIYSWDGENRLVGIEAPSGLPATERKKLVFGYDDLGRRTKKQVLSLNTGNGAYEQTSYSLLSYDSWNLTAEIRALDDVPVQSYLWGNDLSGRYEGAGGVGGLLATACTTSTSSESHFAAYEVTGNLALLVNATNAEISALYEYGPFGELIRITGGTAELNKLRWGTKYFDADVSLSYYGYRYYNLGIGRWLSRDPDDENDGPNVFAYVRNMPQNAVDPYGDQMFGFPTSLGQAAPFAPAPIPPIPPILPMPGLDQAFSDYQNGIPNSYTFGPDAPWTIAIRHYPHMYDVRRLVAKALAAYCDSKGNVFRGAAPFTLNSLYYVTQFNIIVRDMKQIAGGQLDYTINGSFNLTWEANLPINCCTRKSDVRFEATDSFRFGSNFRIPGTNLGPPDNPFGVGRAFNTVPLKWHWVEDVSF